MSYVEPLYQVNKVYFCNLFKVEPGSTYYNNKNAQLNK